MLQTTMTTVRLGTRGSALARWQTAHVGALLQEAWPALHCETVVMTTRGDQVLDRPLPLVGGKGLFTAELEAALHAGTIDLAVHSLKDLPTESPAGLLVGAVPLRADPADVLVSRGGYTWQTLPLGATIGTSSRRRAAQLLHRRPDLRILDIRGNVDTRINKALDPAGPYDATVMAYAGLDRLDRLGVVSEVLAPEVMLPAPGQGALGVQCRAHETILGLLAPIQHDQTALAVAAERAFLSALGGGCAVPIAAYATGNAGRLLLRGRVTALDGRHQVDVSAEAPLVGAYPTDVTTAHALGATLAQRALAEGADRILAHLPAPHLLA